MTWWTPKTRRLGQFVGSVAANDHDAPRWRQMVHQFHAKYLNAWDLGEDREAKLKWMAEHALDGVDCD